MSNTDIWDRLKKTDPKATKSFKRAGGFSGTAIKPQWVIQRLTEEFGPCGVGWGMSEPVFQVVPGHNGEVLVFCTVRAWVLVKDGQYTEPDSLHGVGGDKVVKYIPANQQYNRPERWENDDEAFKKAYTDALMNAFKFIGVAADVHMGLFDDSKYVQEAGREFQERPKEAPAPLGVHPEGPDWYKAEGYGKTAAQAKKDGLGEVFDTWLGDIMNISTSEEWSAWGRERHEQILTLPKGWRVQLRDEYDARGRELGAIGEK